MGQDSFLLLQRAGVLSLVSIWDDSQLLITLVSGHPKPFTSFCRHPHTSGAHKGIMEHSHTQTQTHKYIFKITSIAKMKKKIKMGVVLGKDSASWNQRCLWRDGSLLWVPVCIVGVSATSWTLFTPCWQVLCHPHFPPKQCQPTVFALSCQVCSGDDKIIPDHLWLRTSWLVRQLSGESRVSFRYMGQTLLWLGYFEMYLVAGLVG